MATLIVNGGLDIITNRIKGSGSEPLQLGWGTGAGTAGKTDTTLFTEKDVDLSTGTGTRTTGTSSRQTTTSTNDTYRVVATRTATGAGSVTNAGLFDNATIASGNLFLKGDHGSIALASGDSIQYTVNAVFTN